MYCSTIMYVTLKRAVFLMLPSIVQFGCLVTRDCFFMVIIAPLVANYKSLHVAHDVWCFGL